MSSGSCTALIATTGHSSLSTLFVMQDTGLTGASGATTILNHTSFQPFHFQMAPFTLAVRVPDMYEKKWSAASMANGVLRLKYRADLDEVMIT